MSEIRQSMKKLKSERHHWWPVCVSRHWVAADGKTGWIKPDGSCIRVPPQRLGVIGNGHHIKLGNAGESSSWDHSFEREFDRADSHFPELIKWLEGLERKQVCSTHQLRDRFIALQCTDETLGLMSECATSLVVRGPMNREASVAVAESFRGPLPQAERNALIGLNMRSSQRLISDGIGAGAKFVAIYSQGREFIYGDGFFHNLTNVQAPFHSPKMLVPITPNISILVCRPSRYVVEPKFFTLMIDDQEVERCNHAVQTYSKNAIYFRSEPPDVYDVFRCAKHLKYEHPGNPIDSLIHSIPGVPSRDTSLDFLFT